MRSLHIQGSKVTPAEKVDVDEYKCATIVTAHWEGTGTDEVNCLIPDCTATHVLPTVADLNL